MYRVYLGCISWAYPVSINTFVRPWSWSGTGSSLWSHSGASFASPHCQHGAGTKWMPWAVIKWEGGVLWWWTHLGPFAFARDVAGVGARRVLRVVMRWEGGVFVVLDSPGLVTLLFACDEARAWFAFMFPCDLGVAWVLYVVMSWRGGFFAALGSPGLVTACVRV